MNFWTWLKGPDINKGVAECRETPGAPVKKNAEQDI